MKKTNSNIKLKKFYGDKAKGQPGKYPYLHGIYPDLIIYHRLYKI